MAAVGAARRAGSNSEMLAASRHDSRAVQRLGSRRGAAGSQRSVGVVARRRHSDG